MAHCTARCGHCGRCEGPEDCPLYFYCIWCNSPTDDDTNWPYCSTLHAVHAELDGAGASLHAHDSESVTRAQRNGTQTADDERQDSEIIVIPAGTEPF